MKLFCLICFFLVSLPFSYSQNYYVALIKGEVYYQNKLIKKRDKIKMRGEIRFTSTQDYVKVSGPGGVYTIKPGYDPDSRSEFVVAVREELFPRSRPHSTLVFSHSVDLYTYFFLDARTTYTFFRESYLRIKIPELKSGDEVGYLHFTDKGLIYRTAIIRDSNLVIREKDFLLEEIEGERPSLYETAIVLVHDEREMKQVLKNTGSIYEAKKLIPPLGGVTTELFPFEMDSLTVQHLVQQEAHPAEIMQVMSPPRFINKKELIKDLRFHQKLFKSRGSSELMAVNGFEEYLISAYGVFYHPDFEEALKEIN